MVIDMDLCADAQTIFWCQNASLEYVEYILE